MLLKLHFTVFSVQQTLNIKLTQKRKKSSPQNYTWQSLVYMLPCLGPLKVMCKDLTTFLFSITNKSSGSCPGVRGEIGKGTNYRNFPVESISGTVQALSVSSGLFIVTGGEGLSVPPNSHQRCPSFITFKVTTTFEGCVD